MPLPIPHLSLWMSIAPIVVLFAVLLVVRARRQRRDDNTQPETSLSRETQPSEVPHDGYEKPTRHVSMSIFGR
jgi:cytochrome c-type biogenesis protein CcmH/NrfF